MNALYAEGKDNLLEGNWNWVNDPTYVVLIGTGYTPDTDAGGDATLADIPADSILATSTPLQGKAVSGGVVTASNLTILGMPQGDVEYLVLVAEPLRGGSFLIAILDTAVGLPVQVAENGAVTIVWNTGASGIFAI